jgi:hypothetical protein
VGAAVKVTCLNIRAPSFAHLQNLAVKASRRHADCPLLWCSRFTIGGGHADWNVSRTRRD